MVVVVVVVVANREDLLYFIIIEVCLSVLDIIQKEIGNKLFNLFF